MRRLLCLTLLLLGLMLPVQAEEPSFPSQYAGEWAAVLTAGFSSGTLTTTPLAEADTIVITADGFCSGLGTPANLPLQPDETGYYWVRSLRGKRFIFRFLHDSLVVSCNQTDVYYVRRDAQPASGNQTLTTTAPAASWDGEWHAIRLYVWSSPDCSSISAQVPLRSLCEEDVTLTLPFTDGLETLRQAWAAALARQDGNSPVQGLAEITGYELLTPNTLLLCTRHGLVELGRTDETALSHGNASFTGFWHADALIVGGLPMPIEAFPLPRQLTIDSRRRARLDHEVLQLQYADNDFYIGEYPVSIGVDYASLFLTLAEDVQLRFIRQTDWYRRKITGTWLLTGVSVLSLGVGENVCEAGLSAQLIIAQDGGVTLKFADGEQHFTLYSTKESTRFLLIAKDGSGRYLNILSLSALTLSNEANTYTYHFTRSE